MLERVCSLGLADDVVVATEAEEVAAVIRKAGGRALITSDQHPSGTDRVAEVARHADFLRHDVIGSAARRCSSIWA